MPVLVVIDVAALGAVVAGGVEDAADERLEAGGAGCDDGGADLDGSPG